MFKKNLYLVTYNSIKVNSIHVYGTNLSDAIQNFWNAANEKIKTPGIELDITEIKLIGEIIVN